MAGRALTIDINTRDQQTLAALKRIQRELKDTGTQAERTGRQGLTLGDAFRGVAIGAGVRKSIDELEEAEVSSRQTAAAIEASGNAAQVSAGQQEQLVDSYSKLAAVDDEVVAGGANILRTFQSIKGENFGLALGASLDVAAAKGVELSAASQTVGKALESPAKAARILRPLLGELDEATQQQIASMVEQGDKAGAQSVILAELEKRYGGQAEAAVTGSQRMTVAFGNAAEAAGTVLAPGLELIASGAEKAGEFLSGLPRPMQQAVVAGGILAAVGPRIADGFSTLKSAGSTVVNFSRQTVGAAQDLNQLDSAQAGAAGSASKLQAGVAGAAAGLLSYGAAYSFLEGLGDFKGDLTDLGADLDQVGRGVADTGVIYDQVGGSAEDLAGWVRALNEEYDRSTGDKFVGALTGDRTLGDVLDLDKAQSELDAIDGQLANLATTNLPAARSAFGQLSDEMIRQGATAEQVAAVFPQFLDELERQQREQSAAAGSTRENTEAIREQATALGSLGDAMAGALGAGVEGGAGAEIAKSNAAAVGTAMQELAARTEDAEGAQEALASAQDAAQSAAKGIEQAQRQVEQAHRGVEQAQRSEVDATESLTEAQADQAQKVLDLATAQREAAEGTEDLADAHEQVLEASEKLAESQRDETDAQDELTAARENYQDVLDGLATSSEAAADDVLQAEIRLRKAQQELRDLGKPGKDGKVEPVSADERLAAQIAVREAERALARAQDDATEAQATLNAERQAGVDGSTAVVEAQEAVAEASENTQAAQEALEGAVQNVADTQEEAARKVVAAQDAVNDANDRVAESQQRLVDARQGVVDAQRGVQDAADGVAEAQKRHRDAIREVNEANDTLIEKREAVTAAVGAVSAAIGVVKLQLASPLSLQVDNRQALEAITTVSLQLSALATQAAVQSVTAGLRDAFDGNRSAGPKRSTKGGGRAEKPGATGSTKPSPSKTEVTINVNGVDSPKAVAEQVASVLRFKQARSMVA